MNVVPRLSSLSTATAPPWSFDQLVHQGEPDPCPLVRAAAGASHAVESLEDVRQFLGGNAHAGVAHDELHVVTCRPEHDGDLARRR